MNLKENKGITLIALVITIIVLLILAGISLSMLSGNNGLLTKASQAKEITGVAEYKERIELAYSAALMESLKSGSSATVTKDELKKALGKEGITVSEDDIKLDSGKMTVNLGGNGTYTVDSNGKVGYNEGTYKGGTVADNGKGDGEETPGGALLPSTTDTTPYLPDNTFTQVAGTDLSN